MKKLLAMRSLKHFSKAVFVLGLAAIPALAYAQEGFTPLTNLPGLTETLSADTIPNFLNMLYRLCIGAAAVIAVLQIMRAGTKFFFNTGSVTQNQEGKRLILNSILGLLLVLSPAIVFGIINPDILDLSLDFSELNLKQATTTVEVGPDGDPLDKAPGGTPEENQDADPRALSHTCTSPDSIPQLQSQLDTQRQSTPNGKVYLDINSLGQGGQACCEAVKDTDGSSCKAATVRYFGKTDSVTTTYTCTCGT